MPSTQKDIQPGAIFRPRLSGKYCKKLRNGDKVEIITYAAPDVLVEYTSDKFRLIVSDVVLCTEYKLEKAPIVKKSTATVAQPTTISVQSLGGGVLNVPSPDAIVAKPVPTSKSKPTCSHTHTDWYGEIETCKDCGDTLKSLEASANPYNVDPDLKVIPPSVTAFMNRYGHRA